MNANRFLALYDRVAEAPDAITRLRRFVLDLAVRGKLVPQDPRDEPASELLNRIAMQTTRLIRAGVVRTVKPISPEGDTPYALPITWQWAPFGGIVSFGAGRTPPRNELSFWNTGDFAWISIADMTDGKIVQETKETVSDKARLNVFKSEPEVPGTMIMSFKLTIGKIARLGISAFHNEAIISIRPHLHELDPYLFLVLPDLARGGKTKGAIKGATLNRDSISKIMIPLPPLAEQERIVAQVDELMALCDQLEASRNEREETRDRLARSSLVRLNSPHTDSETFRSHARFAADAIPALTARADQVKGLRQTILNLAVRGKLVQQDLGDEPASELVKRSEKLPVPARYAKRSTELIPGDCGMSVNKPDLPIPSGWLWVPLVQVARLARIRHRFGISSSLCWYWTRIGSRYPLWVVRRYARRVFGPFQERLLPVHRATLTWIANGGRAPTSASRRCSVNAVQRWSSYPGSRHSGSRCRFASTSAKTLA